MERSTPVRKPHTSTADLLTWPETPISHSPTHPSSAVRSHQPSDGIRKVVFGGQVTDEEVESLNKRKPCSDYKMKEITGSGIFVANGEDDALEDGSANPNKTGLKGSIDIGERHADGDQGDTNSAGKTAKKIYDKKFAELSGNDIFKGDAPPSSADKSLSGAKLREMSGSNIFADGKVEARDYLGGVRKPPGGESSIALV
ncbi:hypothetical protein GLYMA_06G104200v4 [Glycine max]|nr:hypothetical protein GLYMA_06G104200v4 [Glycine max]KAH1125180.1 hypothetical protein GYH30_014670 [Glycine max]